MRGRTADGRSGLSGRMVFERGGRQEEVRGENPQRRRLGMINAIMVGGPQKPGHPSFKVMMEFLEYRCCGKTRPEWISMVIGTRQLSPPIGSRRFDWACSRTSSFAQQLFYVKECESGDCHYVPSSWCSHGSFNLRFGTMVIRRCPFVRRKHFSTDKASSRSLENLLPSDW